MAIKNEAKKMAENASFSDMIKPYYHIGQGVLGGIGAFKGAQVGGQFDHPVAGTAIGGATGVFAMPALWHSAAAIGSAEMKLGQTAWNGLKGIKNAMSGANAEAAGAAVGSAFGKVGAGVTSFLGKTGVGLANMYNGINISGHPYLSAALSPVRRMDGIFTDLVKFDEFADKKVQVTGKGKALLLGAAAIGGINNAMETLEKSRLGTIEPYIHTATPQTPQYFQDYYQGRQSPVYNNNAGATGDLAFALSRNRRG